VPLEPDAEKGWKPYPLFKHKAEPFSLSAHASVLMPGICPHPPHVHEEEEILLMLHGEADLLLPEDESAGPGRKRRARAGDFVYYPAGFPHSLECTGNIPANYLMFKWTGMRDQRDKPLEFMFVEDVRHRHIETSPSKFTMQRIFQGPTAMLEKLECHLSFMPPGKGYDEHTDAHDVAIIMLEGEVKTLGKRAVPWDVILYAAGEPHGMHNPGTVDARYLVFEFHFS
jgi:quercetin dioxygenase-like cupin family protein